MKVWSYHDSLAWYNQGLWVTMRNYSAYSVKRSGWIIDDILVTGFSPKIFQVTVPIDQPPTFWCSGP